METYLGDSSQSLEKIKTYYPSLESEDPKGKKTTECPNKYFVMYGENILDKRTLEQKKWVEIIWWFNIYLCNQCLSNLMVI